jgi:hypothetical protein
VANNGREGKNDRMVVDRNGKQQRTGHENEQERQAGFVSWHDAESVASAAVPAGVRYSSFGRR